MNFSTGCKNRARVSAVWGGLRAASYFTYSCSIATPHLNSTTMPSFLIWILSTSIFIVVPSTVVTEPLLRA